MGNDFRIVQISLIHKIIPAQTSVKDKYYQDIQSPLSPSSLTIPSFKIAPIPFEEVLLPHLDIVKGLRSIIE